MVVVLLLSERVFAAQNIAELDDSALNRMAAEIKQRIEENKEDATLVDKERDDLQEGWQGLLDTIERIASYRDKYADYRKAEKNIPLELKKIDQEKKRLNSKKVLPPKKSESISEIEKTLSEFRSASKTLDDENAQLGLDIELLISRPPKANQQLLSAKQSLNKIDASPAIEIEVNDENSPYSQELNELKQTLDIALLSVTVKMLEAEMITHSARLELLEETRSFNELRIKRYKTAIKLYRQALKLLQQEQAQVANQYADEARSFLEEDNRLIVELAEENLMLSQHLKTLTKSYQSTLKSVDHESEQYKKLTRNYENALKQQDSLISRRTFSQVLREQWRTLPPVDIYQNRMSKREEILVDASDRQIRQYRTLQKLNDRSSYIDSLFLSDKELSEINDNLNLLLDSQTALLEQIIATEEKYILALSELDFTEQNLLTVSTQFKTLIDENLLWERSSKLIALEDFKYLWDEVTFFLNPKRWYAIIVSMLEQFLYKPFLGVLLFVALFITLKRGVIQRAINATNDNLTKIASDNILSTWKSLGLSALYSMYWLLVPLSFAFLNLSSSTANAFTSGVSETLLWLAPRIFFVRFILKCFHMQGVMLKHFQWSLPLCIRVRQRVFFWVMLFMGTQTLTQLIHNIDPINLGGLLGKLFLIVTLLLGASVCVAILKLIQHAYAHQAMPPMVKFLFASKVIIAFASVVLGCAVLYGYEYTASVLCLYLLDTQLLIFVCILMHQLGIRWLSVAKQRLWYQSALDRRAQRQEELNKLKEQGGDAQAAHSEMPNLDLTESKVDIAKLNQQSVALVQTSILCISLVLLSFLWSPINTATEAMFDVPLWQNSMSEADQGVPTYTTLFDVFFAITVVVIMVIAMRTLPALLELTILQRLEISAGTRYAFRMLSNYTIITLGVVMALKFLGLKWDQLQWLAAAVSLGIGFGLQEIFANFISGLIILFERPIRIGDLVTIGDTQGFVTKIRIRATTIQTYDRQELLVPNKEFITSRLLNWTLSDHTTRLLIPVGIAYGSDVPQAMSLVSQAAEENAQVMKDPAPFVTFEGFGDNTLNLYLRCYVDSLDKRLSTVTALHLDIEKRFNEAGIEIAFPQRDVHMDFRQPLNININRSNLKKNGI